MKKPIPSPIEKTIPRFIRYGESLEERGDWFVNIEHLAERCSGRGWKIEAHAHPGFGQLLFMRSGSGTYILEDENLTLKSPCVVTIPKNTVHGFDYNEDADGWVLTIDEFYLDQINSRLPEFAWLWSESRTFSFRRKSDLSADLVSQLRHLDREIERRGVGHTLAAEMILTSMFIRLVRAQEKLQETPLSIAENKLIDQLNELIERHFRHDWKVKDYADVMGISLGKLRTIVMQSTGKSPIKLVHDRMITESKRQLVFGEMTIEQIAYWLGMSSPAYFTRFFKKETGQSPSQFRANRQSKS